MVTNRLRINAILVCDDIRREDNGKALLIGVYSGDIVVKSFPFNRALCFWLYGRADKGIYQLGIRIRVHCENEEARATLQKNVTVDFSQHDNSDVAISFLGVPIVVQEESNLIVEIRLDDEDQWQEHVNKRVKLSSERELNFGRELADLDDSD